MSCVWMKVTKDRYELPLVIADSCKELAWKCGVDFSVVSRSAKRKFENPNSKGQYIKVEVDEVD